MGFNTNAKITLTLGTVSMLAFASLFMTTAPQAYALRYDNYGEGEDDEGKEKTDQSIQQDDLGNTAQTSSNMPIGDCDMDANEDPENFLSCLGDR